MINNEESRTDLGIIRIHKNVIASIAEIASLEIEGVKRVKKDIKSGLMELIGRKSSSYIKVEIGKSDEVKIEIPLIIKYEYHIPDIASKVQENVRNNIEKMTNLTAKDININIQGIERG